MFNTFMFNDNTFDGISIQDIEVFSGEVVYNGYILHQTNVCYLNLFQGSNGPRLQLNNFDLPNTDGIGNNSAFYRANEFIVRGTLRAETAEQLQQEKDRFKRFLSQQGQRLQVNFNGQIRRADAYVLGLDSLFNEQHYNITFVPFELTFQLQQGYWEDIQRTARLFENITDTLQEEILNLGTFKSNPRFVLNFISASNVDNVVLTMGDNEIVINNSIVPGDIIDINSKNKEVLLNGVAIDFNGVFPILELGTNPFVISINGNYEVDITAEYRKAFI